MPVSSYQVQRLLREFRRIRGQRQVDEKSGPDADRVLLTEQADQVAQDRRAGLPSGQALADVWPGDLADRTPLPPPVEHELERRAGSFMDPPVKPKPPATIPKMKRWGD